MKLLFIALFASLATLSYGSIHGALVGPSGVVTAAGAIGPVGNSLAWNHGLWGHGLWGHGGYGHGAWGGLGWGGLGWGGHGAAVIGPVAGPAIVTGPSGKIIAGVGHGHGHWWRR